jgi:tetratricopeptide (TPR) repeat protein
MAESHREEIAKLEALYAGNPGGRVFVHLAEAYRKAGEHERARRILDEGLARHTDSASGYVVLGRVLADMQITAEAEVAFRRVLELDGGNLVALRWLGDLARQSGRSAEAASHYRELLIRNPSNEEVRELVETIDREATATGLPAGDESASDAEAALTLDDTSATTEDAFAAMDADAERDEPALDGPASEGEEAALESPAGIGGTAPDVSAWSSAPGETTDAVDSGVEYQTVDDQAGGASSDVYTGTFESVASEADSDVYTGTFESVDSEADFVTDVDDEGLDPDDLRRDDEAEPLDIHLLDAAHDGHEEDEDEYVSDLDVSDLASGGSLPEADDYADETFVADLSAAGTEEPPPDELPGGVDVMDAGEALTLLSDDGQDATGAQPADGVASSGAGAWPDAGTDRHEPGSADVDEAPEPEAEPQVAELAGAAEPAAEWQMADVDEPAAEWEMVEGDEAAEPDSEPHMAERKADDGPGDVPVLAAEPEEVRVARRQRPEPESARAPRAGGVRHGHAGEIEERLQRTGDGTRCGAGDVPVERRRALIDYIQETAERWMVPGERGRADAHERVAA